ncbi:5759_t:CDS:2, partial [Gigaspora margarita]
SPLCFEQLICYIQLADGKINGLGSITIISPGGGSAIVNLGDGGIVGLGGGAI